jgi:hypothetical protein
MKVLFLFISSIAISATDNQISLDNQFASQLSEIHATTSKKTKLPKSDCYPKPLNSVEIEGRVKPLWWFISKATKENPKDYLKNSFKFYGATENYLGMQHLTTREQLKLHQTAREERNYVTITTFKKMEEAKQLFGSPKVIKPITKYHVFFGTKDLQTVIGYLEDRTSRPSQIIQNNVGQNNANQ